LKGILFLNVTKDLQARLKAEGKSLERSIGNKKRNPILLKHATYIKKLAAGAKQVEIAGDLKYTGIP
jgi:hypothetical protein